MWLKKTKYNDRKIDKNYLNETKNNIYSTSTTNKSGKTLNTNIPIKQATFYIDPQRKNLFLEKPKYPNQISNTSSTPRSNSAFRNNFIMSPIENHTIDKDIIKPKKIESSKNRLKNIISPRILNKKILEYTDDILSETKQKIIGNNNTHKFNISGNAKVNETMTKETKKISNLTNSSMTIADWALRRNTTPITNTTTTVLTTDQSDHSRNQLKTPNPGNIANECKSSTSACFKSENLERIKLQPKQHYLNSNYFARSNSNNNNMRNHNHTSVLNSNKPIKKPRDKRRSENSACDKVKLSIFENSSSFFSSPKHSTGHNFENHQEYLHASNKKSNFTSFCKESSNQIDSSGFNQADLYEKIIMQNYRILHNFDIKVEEENSIVNTSRILDQLQEKTSQIDIIEDSDQTIQEQFIKLETIIEDKETQEFLLFHKLCPISNHDHNDIYQSTRLNLNIKLFVNKIIESYPSIFEKQVFSEAVVHNFYKQMLEILGYEKDTTLLSLEKLNNFTKNTGLRNAINDVFKKSLAQYFNNNNNNNNTEDYEWKHAMTKKLQFLEEKITELSKNQMKILDYENKLNEKECKINEIIEKETKKIKEDCYMRLDTRLNSLENKLQQLINTLIQNKSSSS